MSRAIQKNSRRNLYIALGVIAAVLFIGVIFWPGASASSDSKLLDQAKEALEDKRAADAVEDLRLLVQNDPDNEEAKELYKEAKKKLYDQAKKDIKNNDLPEAKGKLNILVLADPDNPDYQDTLDDIPDDTVAENPISDDPADDDDIGNMKAIPASATPNDLLPTRMDSYRLPENGWLSEPLSAGTVYLPMDPGTKKDIDRVISTIAKFESATKASEVLAEEKSTLSDVINTDINGHPVVIGFYTFENSEAPSMATITWARGDWVFVFRALPLSKDTPNNAKKDAVIDVVENFGY